MHLPRPRLIATDTGGDLADTREALERARHQVETLTAQLEYANEVIAALGDTLEEVNLQLTTCDLAGARHRRLGPAPHHQAAATPVPQRRQ